MSVAQLETQNMQSEQHANTGQEERIHLRVLYSLKTLIPSHILAHEKIYKMCKKKKPFLPKSNFVCQSETADSV